MRGSQQHMCDLECCSMSLFSRGIIASTRTEKKCGKVFYIHRCVEGHHPRQTQPYGDLSKAVFGDKERHW